MKVPLILKNDFPITISTRKVVAEYCIKMGFSSGNEYILDFTDIFFISRSCADEFVKTFTRLNCKWVILNYNSRIHSMFEAVINTQDNQQVSYEKVAVTPFLNEKELSRFLAVI